MSNVIYYEVEFGAEATWSYFETAHGKGAVDGIGEEVKRSVWRAILQNRAVVNSAEEFATVAQRECNKIKVVYISKADISKMISADLKARWEACSTVHGTHAIHFVKRSDHNSILVAKNSQFATQDECVQHQVLQGQRNNQASSSTSNQATSSTGNRASSSTGNQASSSTGNQASTSAGNQCTIQPSSHQPPMSIEIESYYAVDYVNRYYIGRAIRKSEVFVTFKYLHSIGTKFYWPGRMTLKQFIVPFRNWPFHH